MVAVTFRIVEAAFEEAHRAFMANKQKGESSHGKVVGGTKDLEANISPVSSFKRCLGFQSHSLGKNIFQKYPPENFLRPPRCRGGAVSATPPIPLEDLKQSSAGNIESKSDLITNKNEI